MSRSQRFINLNVVGLPESDHNLKKAFDRNLSVKSVEGSAKKERNHSSDLSDLEIPKKSVHNIISPPKDK